MKKFIIRFLILAGLVAAGLYAYRYVQQMPQRRQDIPVAKVRQGDVIIRAYSRGELRALRSESILAPNLMGTVQVTQLAPVGAFAREKDLVVAFDDSEVLSRIEEDQLNLQATDENIKQREAELAIRNNQDQVDLLARKYDVRRAELQVKQNELVSAIDARKNVLNLEQAKKTLAQTESDVKSRQEQAEAQIALLRQQRVRLQLVLQREQGRLRQTHLLTTMSGLVSIRQNIFGGSRQFGAAVPDIREGDQVMPGMAVADVLDLSEVEVAAKIGELDRANLMEGQEAVIELDALAGKPIHGKIKTMSGTATANVFAGDPSKKFDVTFSIDMKELLTTVGATPEQLREVMATAERNRSRPVSRMSMSGFSMMRGPQQDGGGDSQEAMQGDAGGFGLDSQAAGGRGSGNSGRGGGRRREAQTEGGQRGAGRDGQGGPRGDAAQSAARGARRGGRGGEGGAGAPGFPNPGAMGGSRFSDQELAAAKLPPPPEEDSGLQVLLRPGLLADVQVIIEKISNAISIPAQAVFERDGKPVVFVRVGERFEERSVTLAKRSESTMVISAGVKPGEEVALSNPTKGSSKKKDQEKSGGSANPMAAAGG